MTDQERQEAWENLGPKMFKFIHFEDGLVKITDDVLADTPRVATLSREKYEVLKRIQPATIFIEVIESNADD